MQKPRVIIVGGDHYNMLGVIRSLGKRYDINTIIISDDKYSFCSKSKYVNKSVVIKNDAKMILESLKKFGNNNQKSFLIPTSDFTSLVIDQHYDELKDLYYTNNINNEAGMILKYMSKDAQKTLCESLGIKTAKTLIINLDNVREEELDYPCILKPIVSAYGEKADIVIVKRKEDLKDAIDILKKKGYKEILYQEYLNIEYEIDVAGCANNNQIYIPGYIKKVHIYPAKKGSTTYGEVIPINNKDKIFLAIKRLIKELGFNGIFDIDFFKVGNDLYFNEINFRNGAISYAYKTKQSNIIRAWIESFENKISYQQIRKRYFFIEELNELRLYKEHEISFLTLIKAFLKSRVKLFLSIKDCKPFIYKWINSIKRKRVRNE